MANSTDLNTGPFVWGDSLNAAGAPDDMIPATGPQVSRETWMDNVMLTLQLLYRAGVWHKGLNADTVDGCHCSDLQPVDADLTAIAALTGTGHATRTADNTWALRNVAVGTGLDVTNPAGVAGDPTIDLDVTELGTVTIAANDHVVISDTTDSTTKKALVSDITGLVVVPTAASTTEVLTGTDSAKFVTPDSGAALWEDGGALASANTITFVEGGYFNITGTTTITALLFNTIKAGRTVWVRFTDALILTHHATNLVLPTGANINTVAGDVAAFVCETATSTRCLLYQRADGSPLDPGAAGDVVASGTLTTNKLIMGQGGTTVAATAITRDASENLSGIGTIASGAHTITQPTIGTAVLTLVSTATGDDPTVAFVGNRVQTTDATVTTLHTFDLSTDGSYYVSVRVNAVRDDHARYHSFMYEAGYTTDGGVLALNGAAHVNSNQGSYTVAMTISGTNLLVEVTGAAAANVSWHMLPVSFASRVSS